MRPSRSLRLASMMLVLSLTACASPSRVDDRMVEPELRVTCTPPDLTRLGAIDAAIALDTSRSTDDPSGYDINQNGTIGRVEHSQISDQGDSILAAQVTALRAFLELMKDRDDVRISLVAYSGTNQQYDERPPRRIVWQNEAVAEVELTDEILALNVALQRTLNQGGEGTTSFSAGMLRAIDTLDVAEDPEGRPRNAAKFVLFLSDSSDTIVIDGEGTASRVDDRMYDAARIALDRRIVFNTFGLGRAAHYGGDHTLSHIAGATGGVYRPVLDPRTLACDLAKSLLPNRRQF